MFEEVWATLKNSSSQVVAGHNCPGVTGESESVYSEASLRACFSTYAGAHLAYVRQNTQHTLPACLG